MKIICLANNYQTTNLESQVGDGLKPFYFMKPDTALLRNNVPFFIPEFTNEITYAVNIVLRINRLGKNISEKFAHRYYEEIGIGIDFTENDILDTFRQDGQPWEPAKGFDYSAPMGNTFISKKQFTHLDQINFGLEINGTIVQSANTRDLILSFDKTIAFISHNMTLRTGDLIFTGTPTGIGIVKPGDRLKAFIEKEVLLDFLIK
jgi:2-keto-4-pentenoate hydratase/2-oxohepta-3-ene-1,7-dioic acid hydratase in catechol pathway